MEKDKTIAYEMAILMKENRELKQKINEWRERFDYLDSEFNKLLQKKEKATTRTQKEITLYTADSDVSYGNRRL